jgi:hypothetical protein
MDAMKRHKSRVAATATAACPVLLPLRGSSFIEIALSMG